MRPRPRCANAAPLPAPAPARAHEFLWATSRGRAESDAPLRAIGVAEKVYEELSADRIQEHLTASRDHRTKVCGASLRPWARVVKKVILRRSYTRMRLRLGEGPVSCQSCGHENPAGARFCNNCGAPLAAPTITREPRSYTPRHLVEKILASRSALRGERKLVTVLFADVVRSMELAERVDPEEWHRLLDRLFRILSGGVHRYEGTINQYTGDGIMALFGAPIAHEDHAQRACAAVLDMARELGALAEDVRRESGLSSRYGWA